MPNKKTEMQMELVAVGLLTVHPENPRRGNIPAIVASIETNGWFGTVSAQRSTGHIIVGNHRFQAAVASGMETVPTFWVDCNDIEAKRIMVIDNRTSDSSTNDEERLLLILTELARVDDGLLGSGFEPLDMDNLIAAYEPLAELPPAEFREHDPDEMDYAYQCPSCRYQWSGKAR
jgi:hypothetical protein